MGTNWRKTIHATATLLLLLINMHAPLAAQEVDEAPAGLAADPPSDALQLTPVARGFWRPHYAVAVADGSPAMYVVEQVGRIWLISSAYHRRTVPFLDLSAEVWHTQINQQDVTEIGMHGLALHPDYASNGYLYVSYIDNNFSTRVVRYTRASDGYTADADSAYDILTLPQPHQYHAGGRLTFGPDGYLFIALGDGGPLRDPMGAGQNTGNLLGSLLRIDVDGGEPYAIPPDNPFVGDDTARNEIWAYGLRNPWGLSFDSLTGDLYITDVGGTTWEELNFQMAGASGGQNYGWSLFEGPQKRADGEIANHASPVIAHDRREGWGCAIIGGSVYRGEAIEFLQGVYIYGDYCSGDIWGAWRDDAGEWRAKRLAQTDIALLSGFGEDGFGEMYAIDLAGQMLRLDAIAED